MLVDELVSVEDVDCLGQVALIGLLEHLETDHVLYPEAFEFENEVGEVDPHDLRRQPLRHRTVPLLVIHPETLPILHPPRPPRPLDGTTPATRHHDHPIHPRPPIKHLHLDIPAIHDILHVRNSDRTLRDVGREYDLSLVTVLKDEGLVLWGHLGMQGEHLETPLVLEHVGVEHVQHALYLLD